VLVNDSMMHQPHLHLHGMWSEWESIKGIPGPQAHHHGAAGQRLAYSVSADALGRWRITVIMLYHMEAGMVS